MDAKLSVIGEHTPHWGTPKESATARLPGFAVPALRSCDASRAPMGPNVCLRVSPMWRKNIPDRLEQSCPAKCSLLEPVSRMMIALGSRGEQHDGAGTN